MKVWVLHYQYNWYTAQEVLAVCATEEVAERKMKDHWNYSPENLAKFHVEERPVES